MKICSHTQGNKWRDGNLVNVEWELTVLWNMIVSCNNDRGKNASFSILSASARSSARQALNRGCNFPPRCSSVYPIGRKKFSTPTNMDYGAGKEGVGEGARAKRVLREREVRVDMHVAL